MSLINDNVDVLARSLGLQSRIDFDFCVVTDFLARTARIEDGLPDEVV